MKFFEDNIVIESDNMRLDIKDGWATIYELFNDRTIHMKKEKYLIKENIVISVDFNTGEKHYRPGVLLYGSPMPRHTVESLERKFNALQILNNHLMEQFLKYKTEWINKNRDEILSTKEPTQQARDGMLIVEEKETKGL